MSRNEKLGPTLATHVTAETFGALLFGPSTGVQSVASAHGCVFVERRC